MLYEWEKRGKVYHHVTQNVDSLLTKAGCTRITELHGATSRVLCLDCDFKISRVEFQTIIRELNKDWSAVSNTIAPDSDVQLTEEQIKGFCMPRCPKCNGGRLKPDIVFFGDNVDRRIVESVNEKIAFSDALLVVGSTIQVKFENKKFSN